MWQLSSFTIWLRGMIPAKIKLLCCRCFILWELQLLILGNCKQTDIPFNTTLAASGVAQTDIPSNTTLAVIGVAQTDIPFNTTLAISGVAPLRLNVAWQAWEVLYHNMFCIIFLYLPLLSRWSTTTQSHKSLLQLEHPPYPISNQTYVLILTKYALWNAGYQQYQIDSIDAAKTSS